MADSAELETLGRVFNDYCAKHEIVSEGERGVIDHQGTDAVDIWQNEAHERGRREPATDAYHVLGNN